MLIDKNILPLVEMENMNEVHFEDIRLLNDLSALIDKYAKEKSDELFLKINSQYNIWFEHTIEHFSNEEKMMVEKNFFAYAPHKSEHDNTLCLMDKVFRNWQETKDISILQKYVQQDTPLWLTNHITTMDTITANFLKNGATPCHFCNS